MTRIVLNKIASTLQEQGRSIEWLSRQLNTGRVTVSGWTRNVRQPSIEQLILVADCLDVEATSLLRNPTPSEVAKIRTEYLAGKSKDGRGKAPKGGEKTTK